MKAKTDNPAEVGTHVFERAGLGKAPFRFVGMSQNRINYPDGSSKAGGSCDYCGTGIEWEFGVKSADGRIFKVGCDCINKTGDKGIITAYKNSPEYRKHQRDLAAAKRMRNWEAFIALVNANRSILASFPHPYGFTDRETGKPMSALDYVDYQIGSGRGESLGYVKKILAQYADAAIEV
jgi:hypothetical protein